MRAKRTQELMLVTNSRGQLCHITEALAQLLGRTRQQAMANASSWALEQILVEPFAQMHRAILPVRRADARRACAHRHSDAAAPDGCCRWPLS